MHMYEEYKERILQSAIKLYNEKGLKFTMDDISSDLNMSKKTIYKVFSKKTNLLSYLVNYSFNAIKATEQAILDNDELSHIEKLQGILSALPLQMEEVDFRQLFKLKDRYPEVFEDVQERIETGWEATISLIEICKEEGSIRDFNVDLFKVIYSSTIERFFTEDILNETGLLYSDVLKQVVDILMNGIIKK